MRWYYLVWDFFYCASTFFFLRFVCINLNSFLSGSFCCGIFFSSRFELIWYRKIIFLWRYRNRFVFLIYFLRVHFFFLFY
eukprot:UN09309